MPKPYVEIVQTDFTGGAHAGGNSGLWSYAQNQYQAATNMYLKTEGILARRGGTQRVHASVIVSAAVVQGGTTWYAPATPLNIAVCNGSLWTMAAPVSIPTTFTSQGGSFNTSNFVSFAPFRDASNDALYVADGSGKVSKWVATTSLLTMNVSATTPSPSFITVYNQRLFAVGDSSAPDTLYWSGLNDGDTLGVTASGGGSAIIRTFGQQKLHGLATIGNSLCLFHARGISVFTGWSQDDFDVDEGARGISSTVGTIAPRTIIVVDKVAYFLSNTGIYRLTEAELTRVGDETVTNDLFTGVTPSTANTGFAVHFPALRSILFRLPTPSGGQFTSILYSYQFNAVVGRWNGSWATHASASPMCGWTDESVYPNYVLFGAADGFVRRGQTTGTADDVVSAGTGGSSYAASVASRPLLAPGSRSRLMPRYLLLGLGGGAGGQVSYSNSSFSLRDEDTGITPTPASSGPQDITVPGSQALTPYQLAMEPSWAFQPTIQDGTTKGNWEVYAIGVGGHLLPRRAVVR